MLLIPYLIYLAAVSVLGVILYAKDKHSAKKDASAGRIPEITLLMTAALGGVFGTWTASRLFHHKSNGKRKWYFTVVNVVSLAVHVFVILVLAQVLPVRL